MTKKYYAVRKGHEPDIYEDWEECEKQVKGFSNADFKGFKTYEEAYEYYKQPEVEDSEPPVKEDSSIEIKRYDKPEKKEYTKGKTYNEIGADETGKEVYGPMVACAVYYDDEFNQDLFNDPEIEIIDSKKLMETPNKFKKTVEKLMDPENKLKFTIVEAIGDYPTPKRDYEIHRLDYDEINQRTNNANAVQTFMLNEAIRLLIDEFGEPSYITYDRFVSDELYYEYLNGEAKNMANVSITDVIPNSRIIEGIEATPKADNILNSPSAAASIIARHVRNEFFEFIDEEYEVKNKDGNLLKMPICDTKPEENKEYAREFIKEEYGLDALKELVKTSKEPFKSLMEELEELEESVKKDDTKL